MATITWKITKLDRHPSYGDMTDVVYTVYCYCRAVELDESFAEIEFNINIPFSNSDSFTPFTQLTETQVFNWVWDLGHDKQAMETLVLTKLKEKQSGNLPADELPWAG